MRILHFHTDGRMATLFVDPLIEAEHHHGCASELVTSIRKSKTSKLEICHDLSFRHVLRLPGAFVRICQLFRLYKPDIVICHNTTGALVPLLAAWWMSIKIRVYFNHGIPYLGYNGVLRWMLQVIEWANCRLAKQVISVSQDMVEYLHVLNPHAQPRLILNGSACGIDLEIWDRSRYRDCGWRQSNQISPDDVVVVFVGRPEKRKGFQHVLRLWIDYFQESQYKLVLCGADQDDVLRFLPTVPPNLICLGFVGNIPEVLSHADALILPSLHEGFSYAVLEAMACGCVVVVNDIAGVRYLIRDMVNGYLIKNNDLAEYAHVIKLLKKDPGFFSDIRKQAVHTASKFERSTFLTAYLSFLDELVKR